MDTLIDQFIKDVEVAKCEEKIKEVLAAYGCTLVFREVFENGKQVSYSFEAVKMKAAVEPSKEG